MTRDQLRQAADIIRETISARDYATLIGIPVNRAGFAQCPFHPGDHTGSLKLYDGRRGWTCFGCHASGDVIELAKRYFSLSFPQAIQKVADDAGIKLSVYSGHMSREQKIAYQTAQRRIQQRKAEEALAESVEEKYWTAFDEWKAADDELGEIGERECQSDEPFSQELIDAINRRNAARTRLDYYETMRIGGNAND